MQAGDLTEIKRSNRKLFLKLGGLACSVASGANSLFTFVPQSRRAIQSFDVDLEADRLTPGPFFIGETPHIVITLPSDEGITFEAPTPASTYSEPDSPTVETPNISSSVDVNIYEGTFEGDHASSLVTDQFEDHPEVDARSAFVEPGRDFLFNAYGFGFESYTEKQGKADRLIGAFIALLSSESLSDFIEDIEDGGDDEREEPCEAQPYDTREHTLELRPVLKHADSYAAIIHWWYSPPPSPGPQLASEPCLEDVENDSSRLEADASFYSCSGTSFAGNIDDGRLGCGFALSPATSGEVYYDCYG
ncbi:hypothetical protein C8Q79DRAFT_989442 [Trametes meyenii]|nr:hypothetical protein C8Q79DRAFT_989442 [Trametes meyenii]